MSDAKPATAQTARVGQAGPGAGPGKGSATLSDWFFKQGGRDKVFSWIGLDSWIDSSLSASWDRVKDAYNAAASFAMRFRLSGWRRLGSEIASEAMTLGVGGLIVMYTLALPAFQEVDEGKWLSTGKYSVKFLDRQGNEIGKRGINLNDSVPLEEIPTVLINATMATEDRRFFEHFGIDFIGTGRALMTNLNAGATVQGGSTLTQQLAKNLFLSSERSLNRKIKEVFLSFWLESRLTKKEILKLYLDRAYMGGGAVGVEAAAQFYFGKSVREINMAEAAMMAGLFKAPTQYAPHVNLPASRARANDVLSNLVDAGMFTSGQVQNARLNPAKIVETRQTSSPDWFLDWAYEEIQRVMEGKGQYTLTARTTVDLPLQQAGDEALQSTIRQYGKANRMKSGALVAMEPDGAVRALVGGLDYGESQFNRATHARRQPGSSFKTYVYATAIETGIVSSKSIVQDSNVTCGNWSPKNYTGGNGSGQSVPIGNAFKQSLNTTAVDLSLKAGREKVVEMTERLGIDGVKKTCSMALGDTGITPLQHTGGYAAFANGGKLAKPYALMEVFNSKSDLVYSRERDEPEPPRVLRPKVVEQMNQLMQLVVTDGTGKKAALDFTHAVGKTGTSSSYRDAWFMGFTGSLVTGVWLGNDDFTKMTNDKGGVTGGSFPAQIWHDFMVVAQPNLNIPTIPGLPPHPAQVAEQQRLAELKRAEPAAAAAAASANQSSARKTTSIMPEQTREALKRVALALRKAGGVSADAPLEGVPPAVPAPADSQPAAPALTPQPARQGALNDTATRTAAAPGGSPALSATRGQP
jgi:penicillin-binding protein 1A